MEPQETNCSQGAKSCASKAELVQKDRAERKKIGKTLDLAAFMEDFKKDTTSAGYWEKAE